MATVHSSSGKKNAVNIIIKPHQSEMDKKRLAVYQALAREFKKVKVIEKQIRLYDAIANAHVVVNNSSTVGLEAMLFQKPVLTLEMPKKLFDSRSTANQYYSRNKLGKLVQKDPAKLTRILYQVLNDKKMKKYAQKKRIRFLSFAYMHKKTRQRLSSKMLIQLINQLIQT